MDIPFKPYLWGEKKSKITGQQVIAEVYMWDKKGNYMNRQKTCRNCSARPHSKKHKCMWVNQCRACLHMNKS